TLAGVWDDDGITFPVLPPAEETEGPWLAPPVWDRFVLGTGRLDLGGSKGPLTVQARDVDLGAPPGERLRVQGTAWVDRKPSRITATADLVVDGDRVNGSASVRSANGKLDLSADLGAPGPAPGRFPDVLGPEALELAGRIHVKADEADLSPLTPSLTAQGNVDFRLEKGRLRVRGDSLAVAGFGMILGGLDVAVELDQLSPPVARPGQTVSVESLRFGMDVGGGAVRFGVARGGVVEIESLEWHFQGGDLTAAGRFDPFGENNELVVGVTRIDLGALVADLGRADLAATGRLSGTLPLRIEGDRIFADGGRLSAGEEGGVIRYQPGGLPPPGLEPDPTKGRPPSGSVGGVDLVVDALRNFHYRTLEVQVNGELTGEMVLGLKIEGSNPDVYDGYPFQLNMNLEGPLADVIKGGATGFRVEDAVEKRFQKKREEGR
ncbi:MAG TPA: YdbH domain-containing protein, partial [Myxococcota bacterium]|nr:YdbH domain-containing protein [Myxococcota bacterium]